MVGVRSRRTECAISIRASPFASFDPATSIYTKLHDFDYPNGGSPLGSLVQASDGKLYGMALSYDAGVIFSFDPATSTYAKLQDFDYTNGAHPYGSLIQASDGKLYGMTSSGGVNYSGVIFSFDPATSTYAKLWDFDDNSNPGGSLVQASDGKLYGMTYGGGSNNAGVIFSFDPVTSTYSKLIDFDYNNGASPYGDLIQASDGKFYGMTSSGGNSWAGVIFSFDPATSTYAKLQDFDYTNDSGNHPTGSLVQASDGKLYGVTSSTGYGGSGVMFSFDIPGSTYTKVKGFGVNEMGKLSFGGVITSNSEKLYGMTAYGGENDYGVIFSFNPVTSTYSKLIDFDYSNGAWPFGSLIQALDGKLYGVTRLGGANYSGVIFSFDPATSTYAKLHDFDNTNGAYPQGNLMQASDGKLYGMTSNGGNNGTGVIFSFDPATSIYTKLHDFDDYTGVYPSGSLMQASDGKLYGMTTYGGNSGAGVIFSFDPATFIYAKLLDFDPTNGAYSQGCSLIQASDGKLYGMTSSGGNSWAGVIFSFDPATSTYAKLQDFDGTNGRYPQGSLIQASDGKLYGTTTYGGTNDYGAAFSYDPVMAAYTKLADFDGANGANSFYSSFTEMSCATATYYKDNDGDGFGDANNSITNCSQPTGYVTDNTDCDDTKLLYADNDGDGFGAGSPVACGVNNNTDCNDADATVNAPQTYYTDNDGDGFGDANNTTSVCASIAPAGYVTDNTDCDDTKLLYADNDGDGFGAGSPVACGVDNNTDCNDGDSTVHSPQTYYADNDGDGFGDANNSTSFCSSTAPTGYVTDNTDCDDTKLLYADNDGDGFGAGSPVACGVNNNTDCNDADATVNAPQTYYADNDGDGFGDANNTTSVCSSTAPTGYVTNNTDCDDTKLLYADNDGDGFGAGSPVACGVNNNTDCNDADATVNAPQTYYADNDGDGFGDANNTTSVCSSTAPTGYVTNNTDCDDTKLLYADNDGDGFGAGLSVACGVDKNTDCNDADATVHSPQTFYADNDGDGFGDANNSTSVCASTAPAGYVTDNTDCDDTKLLYADNDGDGFGAGSPVACGVDNNTDCNDGDATVHSPQTYYADNDGDGFGDANNSTSVCASTAPAGYVTDNTDCDDTKLLYADNDGDGFGAGSPVACGVNNNTDCNNNDAGVHAPVIYYKDNDSDGHGSLNTTTQVCSSTPPAGYVINSDDCNDADASIHPGAAEIRDGKDNNCNGQIDEGFALPRIKINDVALKEGNSGQKSMVFTVTLSIKPVQTVTVNYTTVNKTAKAPTDYVAQSGILTFAPGAKTQKVSILIQGDAVKEPDETFKMVLSNAINATFGAPGIGTILNDDAAAIAVTMTAKQSISSQSIAISPNPANGIVRVQLSGYSGKVMLQLIDMNGNVLREATVQGDNVKNIQQQFNVTDVASGTYLIVAVDEKGNKRSGKVIVAH